MTVKLAAVGMHTGCFIRNDETKCAFVLTKVSTYFESSLLHRSIFRHFMAIFKIISALNLYFRIIESPLDATSFGLKTFGRTPLDGDIWSSVNIKRKPTLT